jgi:hypothetical protein
MIIENNKKEIVMAKIKLPIPIQYFAAISKALSEQAKLEDGVAFTRQADDCMEIFYIPNAERGTQNE